VRLSSTTFERSTFERSSQHSSEQLHTNSNRSGANSAQHSSNSKLAQRCRWHHDLPERKSRGADAAVLGQVNIGLYCCHHIGTQTVSRLSFCISALVLVQPGLLWATIFSKVLSLDICDAKILDAALDAHQVGATSQTVRLLEYDNNHTMHISGAIQQMLQKDLGDCQVVGLPEAGKAGGDCTQCWQCEGATGAHT